MTGSLRLGLAALVAAATSGCVAFSYTVERYGTVTGVNVNLNCRDTYEVFDRPEARALLVVTNPVNEALVACFEGGPDLAERQRRVARIFFEEKTKRPLCRITGETELTWQHREFDYACALEPEPIVAPTRRRRGR